MARAAVEASANGRVTLEVPVLDIRRFRLVVVGDSPLITHRFSEKAKGEMRDAGERKPRAGREPRNPQEAFEGSMHRTPGGGYGFPATGFKAAAVSACRAVHDIKMTEARAAFHIDADLIEIESDPPVMREDMVRIAHGKSDIRYRAEFRNWRATLPISYNAGFFSMAQVVHLFNLAGFGVGIGEWRPDRQGGGSFGRFHVESETGE